MVLSWSFDLGGCLHLLSLLLSIWCRGEGSVSVQHWLSCCSVGLKTAAITGCAVFEHGEMEAFGNRHRICHVKKTLLILQRWTVGRDLN